MAGPVCDSGVAAVNGNYPRLSNRSMEVDEFEVREILRGHRSYPAETSLGSRIEAVRRLDSNFHRSRPRAEDLAELLGVTTRTIERYRRKIRADTLG